MPYGDFSRVAELIAIAGACAQCRRLEPAADHARGAELFSWLATRRQVSGHRRATRRQAIRYLSGAGGRWLLMLSLPPGTQGHENRSLQARLRLLLIAGSRHEPAQPQTLASFTGGQGTINVNCWAPDSQHFA